MQYVYGLATFFLWVLTACSANINSTERMADEKRLNSAISSLHRVSSMNTADSMTATATFGGGCFWCVEAIFMQLNGVKKVVSGYAGGKIPNPTYQQVCTGETGHAEVIQITYDPSVISFSKLLEVFFKTHDPTTLNRQGNDIGTQYRSVVFFHNEEQKEITEKIIRTLNEEQAYPNPIVTEVVAVPEFYPAEEYHQNYYNRNPNQSYCALVIQPKIEKFKKAFNQE